MNRSSSLLFERRLIMEYELFIGCIGGILALFTGFSVIILIECLYFFSVKWWQDRHDPEKSPENFRSNLDLAQPRSNSNPELG